MREPTTPAPDALSASGHSAHGAEIAAGRRFSFGKNWRLFLGSVDEERIRRAESSLSSMLEEPNFEGRRFLDIGCGSGLFSLAARRLGAEVYSFDYDPDSVLCAEELRRRYGFDDVQWQIETGSVLDLDYMRSLGRHEIVYAWGVLHHTGDLWKALDYASEAVAEGGLIFLALYNDQGLRSDLWRWVKRLYCSGVVGRVVTTAVYLPAVAVSLAAGDLVHGRNPRRRYTEYSSRRGMSPVRDWIDWLGGYPFEVASPEEVVEFFRARGFAPEKVLTTRSLGNNQFILRKLMPGQTRPAATGHARSSGQA